MKILNLRLFALSSFVFAVLFNSKPLWAQKSPNEPGHKSFLHAKKKKKKIKELEDFSQSELFKAAFTSIPNDFVNLSLAPLYYPLETLTFAGSIAGLALLDPITTRLLQDRISPAANYKLPGAGASGILTIEDLWFYGTLGGWYFTSIALEHNRGQVASMLAVKSSVWSFLYAQLIIKSIAGRTRPDPDLSSSKSAVRNRTKNPWDWGNVHPPDFQNKYKGTSFPAFHATTFFSAARVFHLLYGDPWIPYTAATLLQLSDIRRHLHWFSDFVAGAWIGIGIGSAVVEEYEREIGIELYKKQKKTSLSLFPYISTEKQQYGVVLLSRF